jgi:hypothetical protein
MEVALARMQAGAVILPVELAAAAHALRSFAELDWDPGGGVWEALPRLLPPAERMPMHLLTSLMLSLATLGANHPGAHALADGMLRAACSRTVDLSRIEAAQLRKAAVLLQGTSYAASAPRPFLSWLLALLEPPASSDVEEGVDEEGQARALWAEGETALTCSPLQRRVMDVLTGLCVGWEAEVAYMGLRLDLVLRGPRPGVLPVAMEIDGPQHFVGGDAAWPTGPTAARRRLFRSRSGEFAGLAVVAWSDLGVEAPAAEVTGLLERVVAREGLELMAYRGGREPPSEGAWALQLALCGAPTPAALLQALGEGQAPDLCHWAGALQRLLRLRAAWEEEVVGNVRRMFEAALEDGGMLGSAPFAALSLLLHALRGLGWGLDTPSLLEAVRHAASAHVDDVTPSCMARFMEGVSDLGYREVLGEGGEQERPALVLLEKAMRDGALLRFNGPELAAVLAGVADIMPEGCCEGGGEGEGDAGCPRIWTVVRSAAEALRFKARLMDAEDMARAVRGAARLGFELDDATVSALMEAAGPSAHSLSLESLAALTLREPAAGVGAEEEVSQRARRRAPQWGLVSEVRKRLRAYSPGALVRLLVRMAGKGRAEVAPAFLSMLASEVYKRRRELTAGEVREAAGLVERYAKPYSRLGD